MGGASTRVLCLGRLPNGIDVDVAFEDEGNALGGGALGIEVFSENSSRTSNLENVEIKYQFCFVVKRLLLLMEM
jgi:hypothetical protein